MVWGKCQTNLFFVDTENNAFPEAAVQGVLTKRCSENMLQIYRRTPAEV